MTQTTKIWTRSFVVLVALLNSGCWVETDPDQTVQQESEGSEHTDHGEGEVDEHGHDENGEEGVVELRPEAIERIGLLSEPVARRNVAGLRTTTGTLGFDEERLAHVTPRVAGRLVRVPGSLGGTVAAGEVLAVLDSTELGEARAAFLRARARHEVAQRRFEREQALSADRISSEQDVMDAEGAARETAADRAASRQKLRLLGLSSHEIEGLSWEDPESSQVSVRAPFAGRVVAREATLGELVSPLDKLFTVADLSEIWLWIDLYERDLSHVRVGARVEVRLDAWPTETFGGELAYIADQLDPSSRTVPARVDLENPDRRLKPGMFARVSLASSEEPSLVLAIPRKAVQRDGDESIVFVRTAPGRFERREVDLGRVGEDLVEVLGGLEIGEDVVTDGSFLLRSQASADELGGHHH
ncbi:MAG: efflux RND transporter periplasmic adaptor subunit [Thermoanaerobaculia bacterium]|nr:efflux RND transporter periplasmic adaptor subunit [Thermoanaerobaculia bacterium]